MRLSKLALIPVIILFLLPAVKSSAQFSYDIIVNNTNGELKLTVKDAATNEPMPWVTVYLTHPGDTVITNFALSDEKGNVKIRTSRRDAMRSMPSSSATCHTGRNIR